MLETDMLLCPIKDCCSNVIDPIVGPLYNLPPWGRHWERRKYHCRWWNQRWQCSHSALSSSSSDLSCLHPWLVPEYFHFSISFRTLPPRPGCPPGQQSPAPSPQWPWWPEGVAPCKEETNIWLFVETTTKVMDLLFYLFSSNSFLIKYFDYKSHQNYKKKNYLSGLLIIPPLYINCTFEISKTRKSAALRRHFSSCSRGLQPPAATVGPFGPSQRKVSWHFFGIFFFF